MPGRQTMMDGTTIPIKSVGTMRNTAVITKMAITMPMPMENMRIKQHATTIYSIGGTHTHTCGMRVIGIVARAHLYH
jgi:hypothetical protein